MFERISLELTNQCSKGCSFSYNSSRPSGATLWSVEDVVAFVEDCAANGVQAVSFGGGEPLEFEGLFNVLQWLEGTLFRSVTTNGLLLDAGLFDRLVAARPNKVHISLHYPQNQAEVDRVIRQVLALADAGFNSGVNLLVARANLEAVCRAADALAAAGLSERQIVYLPMRGHDTPTADEMGAVAASAAFQSMSCLLDCGPSPRFCSIRWDKTVAWCSYTETRRPLKELTYSGLCSAMNGIGLKPCDSTLVQLGGSLPVVPVIAEPITSSAPTSAMECADFPAAHSMDTEWFATDKEGNVAMFDTGEPGKLPKIIEASEPFRYHDFVDEILIDGSQSLPYDLEDFFGYGPGKIIDSPDYSYPCDGSLDQRFTTMAELTGVDGDMDIEEVAEEPRGFFSRLFNRRPRSPARPTYPKWQDIDAVCWLRDVTVVKRLPPKARLLNVGEQVAAWVPACPAMLLRQLYDEGLILSIMAEEFYPAAYRFGVYVYESDDYDLGSYVRTAVPRRPVKANELLEFARFESGRVCFTEIAFADVTTIQPADYMPCFGWDNE